MVLHLAASVAPRAALLSMIMMIDAEYPLYSSLSALAKHHPKAETSSVFVVQACTPTAILPVDYSNPQSLALALGSNRKLQSFAYGHAIKDKTVQLLEALPQTAFLRRFPSRDYTFAAPPKQFGPVRLNCLVPQGHAASPFGP